MGLCSAESAHLPQLGGAVGQGLPAGSALSGGHNTGIQMLAAVDVIADYRWLGSGLPPSLLPPLPPTLHPRLLPPLRLGK